MLVQVVFSLKGMIADLAGEEQVLSMGSLMLLSVVWSVELFAAYPTGIGL